MLHAAIILFVVAIIAALFGAGEVQHYAVIAALIAFILGVVAWFMGRSPPAV